MKKSKAIEVKNISLNYHTMSGETKALSKMTFDVYKNEFLTIVGPSGCGKSTMLSIIAGLTEKSGGEVLMPGSKNQDITELIGYMFQRDELFPWRTILENIFLGLETKHNLNKKTKNHAVNLMKKYGLWDFAQHYPNELSGGMRQKAALIRTLATDPEILLLDEPFSALDHQTRLMISGEVHKIIRNENKTAILISHDISEAINLSDRIIIFSKRPSHVKRTLNLDENFLGIPISEKRKSPFFGEYFDTVWSELNG